jgi:hypothetical protein
MEARGGFMPKKISINVSLPVVERRESFRLIK